MERGKKITQLRIAKGYSQYKLAKLAGIPSSSLSNYESGIRNPGLMALQKILPHLDVTLSDFLSDQLNEIRDAHKNAPPGSEERSKQRQSLINLIDAMPEDMVRRFLVIGNQIMEMRDKESV